MRSQHTFQKDLLEDATVATAKCGNAAFTDF